MKLSKATRNGRKRKGYIKERLRSEVDFHREHPECLTVRPPFPKTLMVDLTNGCNHRCIFCTNRYMTRKVKMIDPSLFVRVISEARSHGVEELGLYTTGEPFMHRDLASFVLESKRRGFRYVYVSTNGALATPDRLKEVLSAGLDSIKFSINAGSPETYQLIHGSGDWEKVLEHIGFAAHWRKEMQMKYSIYVSAVVTKVTEKERALIEKTFSRYADEIFFVDCDAQQGQMVANEGILYDTTKVIPFCSLPFNRLHVSCEGYVTLCCVDYQNYLAVADLHQQSLAEAWLSQPFIKMRKRHLKGDLRGTLCGNCLENRDEEIEPVRSDLATLMNFKGLYQRSKLEIRDRLVNCEEETSTLSRNLKGRKERQKSG